MKQVLESVTEMLLDTPVRNINRIRLLLGTIHAFHKKIGRTNGILKHMDDSVRSTQVELVHVLGKLRALDLRLV